MNLFFSFVLLIVVNGWLNPFALLVANEEIQNSKEHELLTHVIQSIEKASAEISKLNSDVLQIQGMSSSKVRHLLNNLCSYPNTNYLEIGCWMGSTWVSALFGNEDSILNAIAIDDWSLFGGPINEFQSNCRKFLSNISFNLYSENCFKLDVLSRIKHPINIYFYDGGHTLLDQEMAFTYYDKVLDDVFIAIVDDWNWMDVQEGTKTAFDKLGYHILFETVLPARWNSDKENWWNGLYVAVIRKS